MKRPRPHQRVIYGRNIALSAAAAYSAARAVAYAPGIAGGELAAPVAIISADGHLLWAWALMWAVSAVLCILDLRAGHTRRGIPLMLGLAVAWGLGYGGTWLYAGLTAGQWSDGWVTCLNYIAIPALIGGLLYKITGMHDMLTPAAMEEGTGPPDG